MTLVITCDWCGEPIGTRARTIELKADTHLRTGGAWSAGTFGHFHNSDDRDCFAVLGEAIGAFLGARKGLEAIPVLDYEPGPAVTLDEEPATPVPSEPAVAPGAALGGAPVGTPEAGGRDRELERQIERDIAVLRGPGGLWSLELPHGVEGPLSHAGILTVAEVERRDREGTLGEVKGLGPKRLLVVREALGRRVAT